MVYNTVVLEPRGQRHGREHRRTLIVHVWPPLELPRDRELDFLRDPLRLAASLATAPDRLRLVAVAQHPTVLGLVLVDFRIRVGKAKQVAQRVHFVWLPGEKRPPRIMNAMHL